MEVEKMSGYELIGTFTAEEFAKLNDMDVEEIKDCSDARPGAYCLDADTKLIVYLFSDGLIVVVRVNDMADVVVGKEKNWNYERDEY
ncbi:MAG TPA: hypothetical protein VLZ83_06640 [Edaphocola sp.]|nr:hypothetical protein [Edaphocola sp.]